MSTAAFDTTAQSLAEFAHGLTLAAVPVATQQRALHRELDATFERIVATAKARRGLLAAEIDTLCAAKHKQLAAQSDSLVVARESLQNAVAQVDFLRAKNDHARALQSIKQLQTLLAKYYLFIESLPLHHKMHSEAQPIGGK